MFVISKQKQSALIIQDQSDMLNININMTPFEYNINLIQI